MMGGTASGQSYGDLEDSCKLGPITDDLIKDVQFWVKEKRPGAEQLLSRCLKTKEMDVEYEKSEEAKKNNNWVLAKEIVTPLAENGHAKSQGRLGGIYFYGFGEVPKDLKKALKWVKLGAEQGDGRAQYFLGLMYGKGQGVPKDLKQAIKFWELAGDKYPKGFIPAQVDLGALYDMGKEIPKDPKKAFYWYRLAADQGVDYAQFNLGIYYFNGQGVEQDYKEALKWYTKAAKQGYVNSFNLLGSLHTNGQGTKVNFKEAIKWFKLAVEKGDAQAQKNLEIVEKLEKQRIEEEGIAAKGDAKELFELGWKYRNENLGKAIKWYKLSARKGNYDAQVNLTNIANVAYNDKDHKTALGIYEVLAEQGDMKIQFKLGVMNDLGEGTEVSKKDAVIWYEKASKQGHGGASRNLGFLSEEEGNLVEAEKWYKIAVKQGYKDVKDNLDNIIKLRKAEKEKREREAEEAAAKAAAEKEEAAAKAEFKMIMKKAEKYRDVVSKSPACEKEEDVSSCITINSCVAASLIEELKHDDRGKKFKKTVKGGLLSKGDYGKAMDELMKSGDKDELLKNQVMKIVMSCAFQ